MLYDKYCVLHCAASSVIVALQENVASTLQSMGARILQVYHEMVVLERIHTNPHFSPGVSLEALTRPPLRLH